jgi:hypothetical protein
MEKAGKGARPAPRRTILELLENIAVYRLLGPQVAHQGLVGPVDALHEQALGSGMQIRMKGLGQPVVGLLDLVEIGPGFEVQVAIGLFYFWGQGHGQVLSCLRLIRTAGHDLP